jgi:WD40 repeat protein
MKVSLDDIASAMIFVLSKHEASLVRSATNPVNSAEVVELLMPYLFSGDVPHGPYFRSKVEVAKFVKLVCQRADDSGTDRISVAGLFALLREADARLRATRARTTMAFAYARDSYPLAKARWPTPIGTKPSWGSSSASSPTNPSEVACHRLSNSCFDTVAFLTSHCLPKLAQHAKIVVMQHQDGTLSASVVLPSTEEYPAWINRRLVLPQLRGQVLGMQIADGLSSSTVTSDASSTVILVVSTAVNRVHVYSVNIAELAQSQQSTVPLVVLATLQTKAQLLVLRLVSHSGSRCVFVGGSVLGDVVAFDASSIHTDPTQAATLPPAVPRAIPADAVSPAVVAKMRFSLTVHAGPVADTVPLVVEPQLGRSENTESGDERFVVSAGATDGLLTLLRINRAGPRGHALIITPVRRLDVHVGGITTVAYCQTRGLLATAGNDNAVRICASSLVALPETLLDAEACQYLICSAVVVEPADQLVALDIKGTLHRWELRTRRRLDSVSPGVADRVVKTTNWTSVANLVDGCVVTLTGGPATVLEPKMVTDSTVVKSCDDHATSAVHWYGPVRRGSTSVTRIVTAAVTNVKLWDAATGDLLAAFDSATAAAITAVSLNSAREEIVCGLQTGDIVTLSQHTGLTLARTRPHTSPIRYLWVDNCTSSVLTACDLGGLMWTAPSELADAAAAVVGKSTFPVGLHRANEVVGALSDDGDGRVGVLYALSHRLLVLEFDPNDRKAPSTALQVDLTPALRAADSSSVAFCFVEPLKLVAVGDASVISLIDIAEQRPRRRASWSMQGRPATSLAFSHAAGWLVEIDQDHRVWTEHIAPAVAHRGSDADAPTPTLVSTFALEAVDIAANATGASHLVTAAIVASTGAVVASFSSREVVVVALNGDVIGRLDMTASSGADWRVAASTSATSIAHSPASVSHAVDADTTSKRKRRARVVFDRRLDGLNQAHHSPAQVNLPSEAPEDTAGNARHQLLAQAARLAGRPVRSQEQPLRGCQEKSNRTTEEHETGDGGWTVDYPEDLAAEIRAQDMSNRVIAGLPEMHNTIRRLRPSAKTLMEDRKQREETMRIIELHTQAARSPPARRSIGFREQRVPQGVGLPGAFLPPLAPTPKSRTPLPSHGHSPKRRR